MVRPGGRLLEGFEREAYVADECLLAALGLMDALGKPLLIEGEAGVGKTEVAKCLAAAYEVPLIRLQCYEGLDAQHALYDWDYQRQLLSIQVAGKTDAESLKKTLYSREFLVARPLLQAISSEQPVVLLIDEIDRADEEFEALLLEVLSDFQITIPEIGTCVASTRPRVVLTSNGVRELSDALRRRCLYHYLDYPDSVRERAIVKAKFPDIDEKLNHQLVDVVQNLRAAALRKSPGIAETLDWAASLMKLGIHDLQQSLDIIDQSLASLIKTREDYAFIRQNDQQFKELIEGSGSSDQMKADAAAVQADSA
ncbi:MAG: MoxR family ATPase [Granulosicoccus sp.]|nr:MoxR family ATPase [Granulosicoccus sp.]